MEQQLKKWLSQWKSLHEECVVVAQQIAALSVEYNNLLTEGMESLSMKKLSTPDIALNTDFIISPAVSKLRNALAAGQLLSDKLRTTVEGLCALHIASAQRPELCGEFDSSAVGLCIDRIKQQTLLDCLSIEQLCSSVEWTGQESAGSRMTTLVACLQYSPYLKVGEIETFIGAC